MPALDLIRPSVTAMRVIASVNAEFARELKLPPHIRSLGLISADSDDVTYIAADEATKQAMVEVVYGRSLYAGAAHGPSPTAGEVLIMLGGPNPAEVRAGLDAMVAHIENGAAFQWANDAQDTAFLAHVVSRTGSYLSFSDKNLYLTRPDMGRRLCAEAVEALKAQCVANPDVQVVISDGLSTDAITVNYEEILPPLMAGLKQAGLKVGTPFFVRYGRVKIEDQIGEILGAKVVILLVGERPGLGQSESLSCYAVYSPRMATTVEADRTCISNIHQGGTPPVEAAAVIVDLAKRMLEQKASGINMTR